MSQSAFFTIVSANYIAQASVLFSSIKEHHPDSPFFIFVSDTKDPSVIKLEDDNLHYVWGEDIGCTNFFDMAFYYNCVEFNTALKPFAFNYLLDAADYSNVFYLDPDTFLFDNLSLIENKLIDHNIVLTPHLTAPTGPESDQLFLRYGIYNLGFLAVKNSTETQKFINWWMDALSLYCFDDKRLSLFVDQKWIDIVPTIFSGVYIERHPGCNVAYWNLHERSTKVNLSDGKLLVNQDLPVVFFHFSSVTFDDPLAISYKFKDFNLSDRPELKPFFDSYKDLLVEAAFLETIKTPHSFDYFEDGTSISGLLRRVYYAYCVEHGFSGENPFKKGSIPYEIALKLPINGSDDLFKYYNAKTLSSSDWKVRFINRSIVMFFRLVGYRKSIALFKYLANVSDYSGLAVIFEKHIGKQKE